VTAFFVWAALLTLAGLVFVLWPLLRPAARAHSTAQAASLSIYRDQFAELERDLKLGTLEPAQSSSSSACWRKSRHEAPTPALRAAPGARSRWPWSC
jgi:cytochrome c-type biogenesis protein CcmI